MTFIEKLESFQQQLIGVGQTAAACDLQNIIEDYKNAQEPVAWMGTSGGLYSEKLYTDMHPLFTHPPLSDETVKDAERYRWLVKNRLLKGVNLTADCTSQFMASGMIGRARSLNGAIDEAMKAKS